jgi:hypothetical protein
VTADVARVRLRNQRLEGPALARAVDVVRWLVASQAQDFAGAKWALGLRTRGDDDAAVEAAFDRGDFLRTHVMRPTWHFVAQEDLRWLLALTAPRVHAVNGHRYRALGLDAATLSAGATALARALEGGRHLTRDELRQALARAGIATEDQRMAHLLMYAELEAVVVSGPRRGKQFTYALFDERAPRARPLPREEALAELAHRYLQGRAPATAQDFAKWSGLTVADARRGLESAPAPARRRGGKPARGPVAHLISIYDEYISSYRDRSALGDPAFGRRLVAMGNALAYVFLVGGRIAGTWKRELGTRVVTVQLTPFRPLAAAEERAVRAAAARFARFQGAEHELVLRLRP